MDTRRSGSPARVQPLDAIELLTRLGTSLGVTTPRDASDIVSAPMPDFTSPNFRDAYLCKEILRKYPGFKLDVDTHAAAITSLLDDEDRNRATNDRLASFSFGEDPRVRSIYLRSCRKAAEILGPFDVAEFVRGCRFGPKATTRTRGESVGLDRKLSGKPHVTLSALPLAYWYVTECPAWAFEITTEVCAKNMFVVNEHDSVLCVPKNALTDRTICPQPCMNGLFQLGVGYHMRSRLFNAGIDLSDQSVNQRRALDGSRTGRLATVDVKGASNSVTNRLVFDHLGSHDSTFSSAPQWYSVMEALRTTSGWIDGVDHLWELWSSMGNGYTFELETLLFYCLVTSVCVELGIPPDVSVYGDDIICPVEAVPLLRDVFAVCGFRLNMAKSYWNDEGPIFRESCGKHYLDGVDVTPLYVTSTLDSVEEIVLLANNLLRWASLPGFGRDGRIRGVYDWVVSHLPQAAKDTAIPYGEANDGLIKDFDEASPSVRSTCPKHVAGVVVQGVGWSEETGYFPRALYYPKQWVGYTARTVQMDNRAKAPSENKGLIVWLYLKDVARFSPRPVPWFEREPYERYKVAGFKMAVRYGTRCVTSWPLIGPWVLVDPVGELVHRDP